jgi:heptosyltransferase-2
VAFNPAAISRLMIRATNWLGDAVMSLPAIRSIRDFLPHAHIAVVARPWVADLYARESTIDEVIPYTAQKRWRDKMEFAHNLRARTFDAALLLQNAFDAALMAWLARIPVRIGYNRDGRGLLLTRAISVPEPGDIPRHERYYYLELLRRAGWIEKFPRPAPILFEGLDQARESGAARLHDLDIAAPAIGVSPGAAYGSAKQWLPERFAEAAIRIARENQYAVVVLGSAAERGLAESVAAQIRQGGIDARNLAGETTLRQFLDIASACRLFLSNDSGAMHVASALAVPTVAIFGATDDTTTGPCGPFTRVVREHAECAPCLLRECPIDHRCMTRVSSDRVAAEGINLLKENVPAWTHERKS